MFGGVNRREKVFRNENGYARSALETECGLSENLLLDFDFESGAVSEARVRAFELPVCRFSRNSVADEWVTQLLRQGDAKVFKKYSQMKLQMKREALERLDRHANERSGFDTARPS